MGKQMGRLSTLLFLALAGGYLALQMALLSQPDFTTEPAVLQSVTSEIPVVGYLLRNEVPVFMPNRETGYLRYEHRTGERVSKGSVLASLYADAGQLAASLEAARLAELVDRLDGLLSRPGIGVTGLREVDRSVEELMVAMAKSTDQGSGVPAAEAKAQLAYQLTRRQLAVGEFERAQALRDEKEAQRRQTAAVSRPIQTVAADRAGFFVNEVDGYEGIFRSALAGKLNAAQLRELAATEPAPTEGAVCKLVEDFTWYFVCQADDRQAAALEQGRTYRLRFAYAPQTDMPALLEHIYASGEEGYVLTFAGTRMTPEMMLLRWQAVSILQTTYEGLRISNEARRVVDGAVGVYVRSGLTMEFRPVEVIYATETYSIVKWEQGNSGALRLYDEVIITGKDIYEGRIVK